MLFRVRALDRAQQILTLSIEALDETDAREQTLQRQMTPVSVSEQSSLASGGPRRRKFALLLFVQELHSLISAGLSITEALDALAEKEPSVETRAVLMRLLGSLRSGLRLSAAMQRQSEIFPPLLVGIVQAAEGTSDLPRALQRYSDYETRLDNVKQKVVSATIYPVILLVVGGAVSLFLLGYVVPRFAAIYQSGGRELPWASQMLLAWGGFAAKHAVVLISSFGAVVAAALAWGRKQLREGGWWRALAYIPGAKSRLELFELSRLYLTLGMLLEGGIPIHHALRLARPVLAPARHTSLEAVHGRVNAGDALSDAFAAHGLSTPVALRLLRVGEQSGQLGPMLTRAALFYEADTTRWIERFTKVFEPALMTAIGLVIGLIVILLYMPVFDLAGSLQ